MGSTPDTTHEGRGLLHWLRELVCPDIDRRQAAVRALNGIRDQLPTPDAPDDVAAHFARQARLEDEVRRVLAAPGGDAGGYVRRLSEFLRTAQVERMNLYAEEKARTDRVCDRITAAMEADGVSEERRQSLQRRLTRAICGGGDERNDLVRRQHMLLDQQLVAGQIHSALGPVVMHARDAIRALLRDPQEAWHATTVIEKLGPLAAAFAEDLFEVLDAGRVVHDSQTPKAMAAAVRDDATSIARLLSRLTDPREDVAAGAAWVLGAVGRRAAELVPTAVPTLLSLAATGGLPVRGAVVAALGEVAAGNESVVGPLLELSRNADMWVRGAALKALGTVGRRPDLVVTRLVEAFEDYEEPDPDWNYYSNHGRLTAAFEAFGPAAAAAVPALVARIRPDPEEPADNGVLRALAAIGPAAAAALPALCAWAEESGYDPDAAEPGDDLVIRAIRSIRGQA